MAYLWCCASWLKSEGGSCPLWEACSSSSERKTLFHSRPGIEARFEYTICFYAVMVCFSSPWKNNHFRHSFGEQSVFQNFRKNFIHFRGEWWNPVLGANANHETIRYGLLSLFSKVVLYDNNNVIWGVLWWNSVTEKLILGRRNSTMQTLLHTDVPSFPHTSGCWKGSWQWEHTSVSPSPQNLRGECR